jgi:hypothetical protein
VVRRASSSFEGVQLQETRIQTWKCELVRADFPDVEIAEPDDVVSAVVDVLRGNAQLVGNLTLNTDARL